MITAESTKTCKTCREPKALTMFYQQVSNKDGLRMRCKDCELTRHEPIMSGEKTCATCGQTKAVSEFTVLRTNVGGRKNQCKECCASAATTQRHTSRRVLAPASGHRIADASYVRATCQLCEQGYEPIKSTQRFCGDCTTYWRRICSSLTSGRGRFSHRIKVTRATVDIVAKKHFAATSCCYCGRPFGVDRQKSIDHEPPICLGGNPQDPDNAHICCVDCNRAKARLGLSDWVGLCQLVVTRAQSTLVWVEDK